MYLCYNDIVLLCTSTAVVPFHGAELTEHTPTVQLGYSLFCCVMYDLMKALVQYHHWCVYPTPSLVVPSGHPRVTADGVGAIAIFLCNIIENFVSVSILCLADF